MGIFGALSLKRESFPGLKTNQTRQIFGACGGLIVLTMVLHVYSIRKNTIIFRRLRRLITLAVAVLHTCIIRKNTPHLQPLIVLATILFIKEHRDCSAPAQW